MSFPSNSIQADGQRPDHVKPGLESGFSFSIARATYAVCIHLDVPSPPFTSFHSLHEGLGPRRRALTLKRQPASDSDAVLFSPCALLRLLLTIRRSMQSNQLLSAPLIHPGGRAVRLFPRANVEVSQCSSSTRLRTSCRVCCGLLLDDALGLCIIDYAGFLFKKHANAKIRQHLRSPIRRTHHQFLSSRTSKPMEGLPPHFRTVYSRSP
ncbi:hypothetical protein C8R45DRAFT_513009 [Mycena sanguinolenta]|nr:hypothetical protein C8R45DRAFT_513009 [Mycena sanguinolenta]